ncbi:MAG: LUD domain-containing protein [Bacteroidota bacterium]
MSSRDDILKAVKANKPEPSPLPELPKFERPPRTMVEAFREVAEGVGAKVVELNALADLRAVLKDRYPKANKIVHYLEDFDLPGQDWQSLKDAHQLADVDVAILEGAFGVAENAAIWLTEAVLPERVLPFITQHLVLVLPREEIVWNMHEAYQWIEGLDTGFGVFISGPSKTADIEQSLVLGAHGARTLLIALYPASQNA